MKLFKTSILAVLVLCGAVLAVGCGSGADEAVTKYLEAQKARDVDAQVKLMREKDQAEAKESVKAAMEADKEAGNELKAFEIVKSESDSSNALIKVKVTRKKDGKELHNIDNRTIKVIYPFIKINFIEILGSGEEEQIVSFVRE